MIGLDVDRSAWRWEVAADAGELHALLCACDAHQARAYALPAPARSIETTRRRVEARDVHVLRHGAEAAGTFTLSWDAPFDAEAAPFPPARRPAYLGRLAVRPEWLTPNSLVGARCLRHAIELASEAGADAVRSEANPDLTATLVLLRLFGFEEAGPVRDGALRRVCLQKMLA